MNRKETTEFLSKLLEREKLCGISKYWAREVSIDYGSINVRRIDYLQFEPPNQCSISAIEKGIFIAYEIKSCKADFNSGFGKNFVGEKNYLVMPMETYKEVVKPHTTKVACFLMPQQSCGCPLGTSDCISTIQLKLRHLHLLGCKYRI